MKTENPAAGVPAETPRPADETVDAATAQLLIELAFLLPRGTDISKHPVALKLVNYKRAIEARAALGVPPAATPPIDVTKFYNHGGPDVKGGDEWWQCRLCRGYASSSNGERGHQHISGCPVANVERSLVAPPAAKETPQSDFNANYTQCAECGGTFQHYAGCKYLPAFPTSEREKTP